MFVRISPLISFIAAPKVLGSMEATTIVPREELLTIKVPDATPQIIGAYALRDE